METYTIIVLALSGLLLAVIGGSRLSNPLKTYEKNSGIQLANDVNLLNEIRGTSALMLVAGAILLSATVILQLRFTAQVVALLVFGGFAVGRTLSMRLDGRPHKLLIQGLVFELLLGVLNAVGLLYSHA